MDEVNRLNLHFDEVVSQIDAMGNFDDQIFDLEHRNKINSDKIDDYRREIVPLEQNIKDLERILESMCS